MNEMQIRIIIWVIIVALLLGSGIILRRKGRPYKTGTFTVHKLSAIASIIISWIIFQLILSNTDVIGIVSGTRILIIVIAIISTISGAIQGSEKPVSKVIVMSHRISSYFLILLIVYKLTSYY